MLLPDLPCVAHESGREDTISLTVPRTTLVRRVDYLDPVGGPFWDRMARCQPRGPLRS